MSDPLPFSGMGTISAQPGFRPVKRRDLMSAVNTLGRDLGLRPASVVVLDALLSCLPCKSAATGSDSDITPATLLTVFASNATLCYRAKGITDRQLRRHLERLEDIGLIQRRDSANGKRFPVYRAGKVIGAFGLDLTPLLLRASELMAMAERRRDEAAELRGLKAHIQTLRVQCLRLDLDEAAVNFVESTRNLMRRAGATALQARAIIRQLTDILMGIQTNQGAAEEVTPAPIEDSSAAKVIESRACEMPATDGQNVRHKETPKPYTKKSCPMSQAGFWTRLTTIRDFYPDAPTSEHGLCKIIYEFGKMLGIGHDTVTVAVKEIGAIETLRLQDQMADRIASIVNTDGYLRTAVEKTPKPQVGHGQLSGYCEHYV